MPPVDLLRPIARHLAASALALAVVAPLAEAQVRGPRVRLLGFATEIALDTMTYQQEVLNAPMGQVFAAVRATYTALRIPRTVVDSAAGMLGNPRWTTSRMLAGERFSTYLNCGDGITGPNADSWRLTVAMMTYLTPAHSGKTRIGTGFVASSQDMGGVSKDPLPCASYGRLETRIIEGVKARLGAAP